MTNDDERDVQERLLDATVGVIGSTGPRRFRIQDIADAAGVSRQTVVNHLGRKDDVIRAYLGRTAEIAAANLRTHLARTGDWPEAMAANLADQFAMMSMLPAFQPPIRQDQISMMISDGGSFMNDNVERVTTLFEETSDAMPERARRAALLYIRFQIGLLVAGVDGDDVPDLARDVATATWSVLSASDEH